MTSTTDPLLTEIADLLRRIVLPASWETSEGVQRDAADLLARLVEHGVSTHGQCPGCRSGVATQARP